MLAYPKGTHFHFIGIAGIGMSGLAHILLEQGYKVSGSDLSSNSITIQLEKLGATIYKGHSSHHVVNSAMIVYSSAITKDNPEWQKGQELKLRFIKRGELLAEMVNAKEGISIAGSHGKTTTTSLAATLFASAKRDATFLIGGVVEDLGGNAASGKGEYLIAEADESDASFLFQKPKIVAITNIDNDHLDHFGTKSEIIKSFQQFVSQIKSGGALILNLDDPDTASLQAPAHVYKYTYSVKQAATFQAIHIMYSANGTAFTLLHNGRVVGSMRTHLIGEHNVLNTLAAIALASSAGLSWVEISEGLEIFRGVGRRLEKLYERNGFLVLDDYGHHPTEIKATLSALKKVDQRKLCVVFEPHRYTRTKNFWNEFQEALSLADEIYLTPIYAASEQPIAGITSEKMFEEMKAKGIRVHFLPQLTHIKVPLKEYLPTNCIFLSLGAGSISKAMRDIIFEL